MNGQAEAVVAAFVDLTERGGPDPVHLERLGRWWPSADGAPVEVSGEPTLSSLQLFMPAWLAFLPMGSLMACAVLSLASRPILGLEPHARIASSWDYRRHRFGLQGFCVSLRRCRPSSRCWCLSWIIARRTMTAIR